MITSAVVGTVLAGFISRMFYAALKKLIDAMERIADGGFSLQSDFVSNVSHGFKTPINAIEDNGPGIPEDARRHVFNKFYQTDSSHKSEGSGLGLALVKQIVTLCGGTVETENRAEGGCRFVVKLPVQ